MTEINTFIKKLENTSELTNTVNLYAGRSRESQIRRNNLKLYLTTMKEINPSVLLLGEAPGYKGCKLTGVPFSSEKVLTTNSFFVSTEYECINNQANLQSESSATIVWSELANYASLPLIWNIFPFHPHEKNNPQSNRRPNKAELELGKTFVVELIKIFEIQQIITLGRSAESKISDLGIQYHYVRHPSFGGKQEFTKGLKRVMVK